MRDYIRDYTDLVSDYISSYFDDSFEATYSYYDLINALKDRKEYWELSEEVEIRLEEEFFDEHYVREGDMTFDDGTHFIWVEDDEEEEETEEETEEE